MAISGVLPASFRGVPFAVERNVTDAGRRLVAHEYPGRDGCEPEDLGRRGRRYRITGFLLSNSVVYGGGPVAVQRQLILAACDQTAGSGLLIHPTLGVLTVSCENISIGDDLDAGTKAEVEFSFVEYTKQIPFVSASTLAAITSAALLVDAAASAAFQVSTILGSGASTASATWSAAVVSAGQDATALVNLASQLPGDYGRYFAGSNEGYLSSNYVGDYGGVTTLTDLTADASTARAAISAAAATVATDFTSLTADSAATTAGDVQALVAALLGACSDPSDAIRILSAMTDTETAVTAVDDLYRRAMVTAIARASSDYQPSSYDDAVAVQTEVVALIDNEITVAGDEGDDDAYAALRALRVAVVADLQARGGLLSSLSTFTFPSPMPALAMANLLYGDASRSDQLISEAAVVNPLFMPTSLRALAA